MAKVTFTEHTGNQIIADVSVGQTLMEAARDNNVAGVVAECSGACACATCHVYIHSDWVSKLPSIGQAESDMLEFSLDQDPNRSRLSCQVIITEALDGLIVDVPEDQM